MPSVTLAKAVRLPGHPMRPAGSTIDVSQDVIEKFSPLGVFADPSEKSVSKPVESKDSRVEATASKAAEKPSRGLDRPRRSASADEWRKYAESMGISPKGLSKQELIAATR